MNFYETTDLQNATRSSMASKINILDFFWKVFGYGLVLLALQSFTFWFRFPPLERSPIWIPGSFILAVALSTPLRNWWAVFVATTIAGLSAYWSDSVFGLLRATIAIPTLFLALLVAVPAIKHWGREPILQSTRSLIVFFPFAVFFIPLVCISTIYFFAWLYTGDSEFSFWPTHVAFSVSHSLGYLIGTPIFFLGLRDWRQWLHGFGIRNIIEFGGMILWLGLINHLIFNYSSLGPPLTSVGLYLPLLPMIWMALRYGVAGTSCCLILFAYQAAWGAIHGRGPFLSSVPAESVMHLQIYLVTFSFPLLILGVAFEERGRALIELEQECRERQDAESRFRTLVDMAPVAIVMVDLQGTIQMVNECAEQTFGRKRSELLGQPPKILFSELNEKEWSSTRPNVGQFSVSGRIQSGRGLRSSGEKFPIEMTSSKVKNSAGEFALLAIVDISERKRAEVFRDELAQASRLVTLGSLATSIAHEINQPLGAILSNSETAELLLESESPSRDLLRKIMGDIRRDNQRASEVIKRMRTFLRHGNIEMKLIDPVEMIREVVEFVRPEASYRQISIRTELIENLPKIPGEKVHLQQVLLNLMVNGMDAMRGCAGHLELTVRANVMGDYLEIEILDRGHGIESQQSEKLFEKIYSTKENGLGLGLVISRSLIESHRGQIGGENLSDGGARFWIRLPASISETSDEPADRTVLGKGLLSRKAID